MNYNDFLLTVQKQLQDRLGPDHRIDLRSVPKNNGVLLDGLCDHYLDSALAPTIYLNSYYEQLLEGTSTLPQICEEIIRIFSDNPPPQTIKADELSDFSKMKSRVMMKLIHADLNQDLLRDIPHIPYLDLAIVFYLFLDRNSQGQMTALIHNDHLTNWHTHTHELFTLAMQNTPLTYPAEIRSMTSVLYDIAQKTFPKFDSAAVQEAIQEEDISPALYVLSNQSGIYGAASILYPDILKNFADRLNHDLVVIPSSIHEVLLTPIHDFIDFDEMNHMVNTINQFEVSQEERLSSHVYCYYRAENKLSIPPIPEASA